VVVRFGPLLTSSSLLLLRIVQPSGPLVSVLLAKDHIIFLDAIMSPPRILPFEYFQDFEVVHLHTSMIPDEIDLAKVTPPHLKVMHTFIKSQFRDHPGSVWV